MPKDKLSISFSILYFCFFNFCYTYTHAQDKAETEKILRTIADSILKDAAFQFIDEKTGKHFENTNKIPSDSKLKIESRYNDWRYWNGIINMALTRIGEELNEASYSEFSAKNIAFAFDNYKYFEETYNDEGKWNYPLGELFIMEELDDCGAMGASVIEILKNEPNPRYKEYIDEAADHILNKQSRLEDGTLARSFPYKWTLWADDLYMSISFLSRMGELTGDNKYFNFAAKQVINFNKCLFDDNKELMYHNWYSDLDQHGVAFWGRANGWALLAQVDLLDHLPENYPLRDTLITLLQRHILGIAKYQSVTGLWHQLLDKEDSYLETSCSGMFTYTIARAVNRGYLDKRYSSIAEKGWEGILSKIHPDGQIEGVCTGTVVSDNLVDYYNRPTPLNDIHGIGTVLLAGAEMLGMKK